MKKWKAFLLFAVTAAVVSACGGESSDSDTDLPPPPDFNTDPPQTLKSFDISGSAPDTSGGRAPIDPAISSGQFGVSWEVADSRSLYDVAMAVSLDDSASAGDVVFYARTCGSLKAGCPEAPTTNIDCIFNNSNELSCVDDPDTMADLSTFLDVIPKDAFVVIETCTITGHNCFVKSHPVVFQ